MFYIFFLITSSCSILSLFKEERFIVGRPIDKNDNREITYNLQNNKSYLIKNIQQQKESGKLYRKELNYTHNTNNINNIILSRYIKDYQNIINNEKSIDENIYFDFLKSKKIPIENNKTALELRDKNEIAIPEEIKIYFDNYYNKNNEKHENLDETIFNDDKIKTYLTKYNERYNFFHLNRSKTRYTEELIDT